LLWLLMTTLTKLQGLWTLTKVPGWNVQYILCRWVDALKSIPSTLKTWRKRVWKEDGDLPQDFTYPYSEMHGALDQVKEQQYKNAQHEKAMKAPISEDRIRKAGW
jgi:hypothetical protein